jgi:steroid delta-isomerase-like uncharacterized protein
VEAAGAVEVFNRVFYAASPDVRCTVEDLIAEGDRVAARWTMRGTHRGELYGIPATGKSVTVASMSLYRLREGKIGEGFLLMDNFGLLQQLGVVLAPGSPAA